MKLYKGVLGMRKLVSLLLCVSVLLCSSISVLGYDYIPAKEGREFVPSFDEQVSIYDYAGYDSEIDQYIYDGKSFDLVGDNEYNSLAFDGLSDDSIISIETYASLFYHCFSLRPEVNERTTGNIYTPDITSGVVLWSVAPYLKNHMNPAPSSYLDLSRCVSTSDALYSVCALLGLYDDKFVNSFEYYKQFDYYKQYSNIGHLSYTTINFAHSVGLISPETHSNLRGYEPITCGEINKLFEKTKSIIKENVSNYFKFNYFTYRFTSPDASVNDVGNHYSVCEVFFELPYNSYVLSPKLDIHSVIELGRISLESVMKNSSSLNGRMAIDGLPFLDDRTRYDYYTYGVPVRFDYGLEPTEEHRLGESDLDYKKRYGFHYCLYGVEIPCVIEIDFKNLVGNIELNSEFPAYYFIR